MNAFNPTQALASRVRRHLLGAAAGTALAAALPFPAAAQATTKRIRFAHTAPLMHGWHLWAEQFKKGIEARTGGKIQVQIFPNAQMGNERDTGQAVRSGALEMGAIGVGLSNWVPELAITDAPFLWKSRAQAYGAFGGAFGAELARRCMDKGFVLTGWTDLGFRCITNNKRAVTSAKDLQDLKMRVPVSKAYIAMMQAMGASTVAVDLSELYLALRQGVADGQDTPPSVVKSNKYYEVQKFVTKTDHVLTTGYTIANPKFFASLNPDEKAAFLAAATEADNYLRDYTQKDELEAYAFLKAQGMQVTLDPDAESFRKACAPVIAKLPELFPPDLVKMAQATPV
ncbi:TRAP transporter substrate-binding protein [Variovorax sp. dw_954]|uniref:TRAP transporter substrate-binding protein n=1 Tax=Variovorax sp. dw_954 TaxID=2720078 RepID=UPI001BD2A410|nr:TRAP transporter substrate-binding protein [Variovorax sp. dw_954]